MTPKQELAWEILRTPEDIDFIEYRQTRKNTWLTKERKILHVRGMRSDHILSCLGMLERCDQQNTLSYEGLTQEMNRRYEKFKKEQK